MRNVPDLNRFPPPNPILPQSVGAAFISLGLHSPWSGCLFRAYICHRNSNHATGLRLNQGSPPCSLVLACRHSPVDATDGTEKQHPCSHHDALNWRPHLHSTLVPTSAEKSRERAGEGWMKAYEIRTGNLSIPNDPRGRGLCTAARQLWNLINRSAVRPETLAGAQGLPIGHSSCSGPIAN